MKKHLIAAAVAAAVAVPAMAQNVTVYGLVDSGYNSRKDEGTLNATTGAVTASEVKVTQTGFNNIATSRIGFRGSEDLGGGLRANFQVETGFTTAAASTIGDRAAWVELAGGFGALRVGRQDTNQRGLILAYNLPGYLNVLGNNMSATAVDTGNGLALVDDRYNAIKYFSPDFSGVRFNAAYFGSKTDSSTNSADAGGFGHDVGLMYTKGPLSAGVAYTSVDTKGGTSTDKTRKVTKLGASYNFGPAIVAAMYQDAEIKDSVATTTNQEVKAQQISIRVPMGALTLAASIGTSETMYATNGVKYDADSHQLHAGYALSKRTTAFASYGKNDRDANTGGVNLKATEFAFGLVHTF